MLHYFRNTTCVLIVQLFHIVYIFTLVYELLKNKYYFNLLRYCISSKGIWFINFLSALTYESVFVRRPAIGF